MEITIDLTGLTLYQRQAILKIYEHKIKYFIDMIEFYEEIKKTDRYNALRLTAEKFNISRDAVRGYLYPSKRRRGL